MYARTYLWNFMPLSALPKQRQRNRDETEAALIAAASRIFAEKGYEATTTSAIAMEAGYSEVLIQRYFGGKGGLLLAVIRMDRDEGGYLNFLNMPLQNSVVEEVRLVLRHVVSFMAEHSEQMRIIVSRIIIDSAFLADFQRIADHSMTASGIEARLRRYVEIGLIDQKIDLAAATELLMSMNFQLGFVHPQMHQAKGEALEKLIENFAVFFARAMRPPVLKEIAGSSLVKKSPRTLRK
jgi:AcrR family transcriptional regulator